MSVNGTSCCAAAFGISSSAPGLTAPTIGTLPSGHSTSPTSASTSGETPTLAARRVAFRASSQMNVLLQSQQPEAALPYLKSGSAIINTGSITGLEGNKTLIDYAATKGAIHAFTKSLASNLLDKGIRVNAVAPGVIKTPMHAPETHASLAGLHPLGRMGEVSEIVEAVLYLESAAFVTGETLHVDGGAHAGHW